MILLYLSILQGVCRPLLLLAQCSRLIFNSCGGWNFNISAASFKTKLNLASTPPPPRTFQCLNPCNLSQLSCSFIHQTWRHDASTGVLYIVIPWMNFPISLASDWCPHLSMRFFKIGFVEKIRCRDVAIVLCFAFSLFNDAIFRFSVTNIIIRFLRFSIC